MTTKATESEYYKPSAISDLFIARLMQCSTRNDGEATWRLAPGMQVRIRKGPFAMYTAAIESWSSDDRCRLIVWLLGRDVTVEVHAADVIAI
jgi:transcription antitermination factor NusG